jgi:3-deoxy-7-phosphoheptulonate synthase / chorismate mutase
MASRTRKTPPEAALEARRKAIDGLNLKLLRTLEARADLAVEIARTKVAAGKRVHDPARERAMIDAICEESTGTIDRDLLVPVFAAVIRGCRELAQRRTAEDAEGGAEPRA